MIAYAADTRGDHVSIPFVSLRKLRAVSAGIAGRRSVRALIFWSEEERRERMAKIEFLVSRQWAYIKFW